MSTHDDDATPAEEMKRKFREALEKKNASNRKGAAHLDGDSSVHAAPAPSTRREFRRKSG